MRQYKKKWLFDKGKTSGSRKRWSYGGDFCDERNTKKFKELEDAPKYSGMKTGKVFNNRLSFRPLRRFLKAKTGFHWNAIYSEIKERIPKDILEINNPISWYVYDNVEILSDGSIINKNKLPVFNQYHNTWWNFVSKDGITSEGTRYGMFYVHPESGLLCYLIPKNKENKLSKKEGKKKFAEVKKSRKGMKGSYKKAQEIRGDSASDIMRQKKKQKDV